MKLKYILPFTILFCIISIMIASASENIEFFTDLNKRNISAQGKLVNAVNQKATVIILKTGNQIENLSDSNIDENTEAIDQVDVAIDGSFSFEYKIRESDEGNYYNVVIGGRVANQSPIYIDSVNNIEKAVTDLKGANKENIVSLIINYKDTLQLTNIDDFNTVAADAGQIFLNINQRQTANEIRNSFSQALAIAMINQSASNFDRFIDSLNITLDEDYTKAKTELYRLVDIHSAQQKIKDLDDFATNYHRTLATAMVNVSNRVEMSEVLKKYNDVFNLDLNEPYKRNTIEVNKSMCDKGFNNAEEVRKAFNNKINSLLTPQKPTGGSGGGGGQTLKDNTPIIPALPNQQTELFNDLADVQWAKDAILYLSKNNVIVGFGNNDFKPMQNVTREEFVKMLVTAFNFSISNEACDFTDLNNGHWSYPYVATAQKIGLTSGRENNRFGIGSSISRQEAATMLYRIIKLKNLPTQSIEKNISFDDNSQIEQYAYEGINYLYNIGVINGMEDNLFSPNTFLTRAQGAKLIYGLLLEESK